MVNYLETLNLKKSYNKNDAINNITICVKTGECLGVLGDNGSGKSTLMSIIAGMRKQESGVVLYNGEKISRKARKKIAYVPQDAVLIEDLSVKDNLKLWASVYGLKDFKKVLSDIPNFLLIDDFINKKIKDLSGEMKKKVSIAVALMNNPDFLILDEAFAALDFKTIESTMNYLKQIPDMGIIYSSHNLNEIVRMCDKVIVLKKGNLMYSSSEKEEFTNEKQQLLISKF